MPLPAEADEDGFILHDVYIGFVIDGGASVEENGDFAIIGNFLMHIREVGESAKESVLAEVEESDLKGSLMTLCC